MSRLTLFNSPLMLGFDHFEQALERVSKAAADGYPPYNIEQIGEDGLRITLAVAGFGEGDLAVQLEDNQLVIRGKQGEEEGGRIYLHRGIAARQFQRSFVLADGIEVVRAYLESGLLHVELRRPPAASRVRQVKIEAPRSESPAGRRAARKSETIELAPAKSES